MADSVVMGEPCPICRRMDGGHDQAVHDAHDQGVKSYPPPKTP